MPRIDFSKIGEPLDRDFIDAVFEEISLTLGGLVAVHLPTVDPEMDDFLWRLCRNLDVIRARAVKRLDPRTADRRINLMPHPAIEELVKRSRNARDNPIPPVG